MSSAREHYEAGELHLQKAEELLPEAVMGAPVEAHAAVAGAHFAAARAVYAAKGVDAMAQQNQAAALAASQKSQEAIVNAVRAGVTGRSK